ncbi:unnamed protein product [Penicillium nalgiovense]|nr:unnamed protein product [Penicillium nalgiovense]
MRIGYQLHYEPWHHSLLHLALSTVTRSYHPSCADCFISGHIFDPCFDIPSRESTVAVMRRVVKVSFDLARFKDFHPSCVQCSHFIDEYIA